MKPKTKQTVSIAILAAGLALLLYGALFHVQPVFSENNDKGLATAESVLVKEVSIGGLKRDANGNLHKTYSGKPPAACPT